MAEFRIENSLINGIKVGSQTVSKVMFGDTQIWPSGDAGYFDCGYGCQFYSYNPGCLACVPNYITLYSSLFTYSITDTFRVYYVNANVSPYNQLLYSDLTSYVKTDYNHSTLGGTLFVNYNSGSRINPYLDYPLTNKYMWGVVIYKSGTYYKYSLTEYTKSGFIDDTYYISDINYLYKLSYVGTLSGWPTTA
jgi:hypothetical protein